MEKNRSLVNSVFHATLNSLISSVVFASTLQGLTIIHITAINVEFAGFMVIVLIIVMFVAFVLMFNYVEIINVVLIPLMMNAVSAWRMHSQDAKSFHVPIKFTKIVPLR